MRVTFVVVTVMVFATFCSAIPRNKRQADEPRLSNEVIPGIIADDFTDLPDPVTSDGDSASTEMTRKPAIDDQPTRKPGKKPTSSPVSPTFSRVIDDIFNIPISVLRAVNTLISNAFGTKQGTSAAASASEAHSSQA